MPNIILLGTCDTKLDEILFLRQAILDRHGSISVTLIDVGREDVEHEAITLRSRFLRSSYSDDSETKTSDPSRGDAINSMTGCATKAVSHLYRTQEIHGVVAVGGSGGTSLAAAVMRNALPIGFPKLIVSTVASGDTGPIVQETDITLMYSVVDIAGLNPLLRKVLSNAAAAVAGMALSYAETKPFTESAKKRVGITMFGVTTPAVDKIRSILESEYDIECYVFHATGHGGKAMERLVREGALDAVLDLTTTEICDFLTGGNMACDASRLEAAAEAGIPNIISIGATDMSNFGPRNTVPECFNDRLLYEHNSMVTLMRSSVEESNLVGEFIVQKLKEHVKTPEMVEVWLPRGGVSVLSIPGGPFDDTRANAELIRTIKRGLRGSDIAVVEDERAINDPEFASDIAHALVRKMVESKHENPGDFQGNAHTTA